VMRKAECARPRILIIQESPSVSGCDRDDASSPFDSGL
jgi:hypothetical protein